MRELKREEIREQEEQSNVFSQMLRAKGIEPEKKLDEEAADENPFAKMLKKKQANEAAKMAKKVEAQEESESEDSESEDDAPKDDLAPTTSPTKRDLLAIEADMINLMED